MEQSQLNYVYHHLFQIFIPILHGLTLAVKECSFDSDNFKFPLMVRTHCPTEPDRIGEGI